eukprot:g2259.t1
MSFAGTIKIVSKAKKQFKNSLTHEDWARQKEFSIENRQYEQKKKKMLEKKRAEKRRQRAEEVFLKWTIRKSRYEKVKALLLAQTAARASNMSADGEMDDWEAVGVAAAAGDCMLGIYDIDGGSNDASAVRGKENGSKGKGTELRVERKLESLRTIWYQWSRGRKGDTRHQFMDVAVNAADAQDMSPATQENMKDYATSMRMKDEYVLSALAYTPPLGRPARNQAEEVAEATSKILNSMWNKKMKQAWKECQKKVIKMYHVELEKARAKDEERVRKALEKAQREREREGNAGSKARDVGDEDFDQGSGAGETGSIARLSDEELKDKVLYNMSITKLKYWIRKDKEADDEAAERALDNKRREGNKFHRKWVERKDRCMIKLPKQKAGKGGKKAAPARAPRMDFSVNGIVRPKKREISRTSAEIMLHSGLKYVHAISHQSEKNPNGGDLERSRAALLERGVILKSNFKDVHDGRIEGYEDAKRGGSGTKFSRELRQAKEDRNDSKHFEQWSRQKSRYDAAVRYLEAIDRPLADGSSEDDGSSKGSRQSKSARAQRWRDVGRLLKGIDTNLLPQWAAWSKEYRRFGECQKEWKTFPPKQGEIKGMDVLLKIIKSRRDFDWEAAFSDAVIARARREGKEDDLTPSQRESLLRELKMNKKEVRKFFLDNGCALTLPEVTQMFDAFDADKDGMLSAEEFTSFAKRARVTSLNPTGPFWAELAQKKERQRRDRDGGDARGMNDRSRESYGAHEWREEDKNGCLDRLKELARVNLKALKEARILEEGKPPLAPRLWLDRDAEQDGTDRLTLRWSSSRDDGPVPIFYNLELFDDGKNEFASIFKDPESAGSGGRFNSPLGLYTLKDLEPNTRYNFKITAFNGFGPSVPTYKSFTTLPKAPPRPIVVGMAVTVNKAEVTLSWGETSTMNAALKELHDVFQEIDSDDNGMISEKEFKAATRIPRLREFFEWCCGSDVVFGDFDANNDGKIDFMEFCKRLTKRSSGNTQKYLSVYGDADSGKCTVEGKSSDAGSAVESGTKFELFRCTDGKWDTVTAATHETQWTVTGLTPGQTYQFTVCAFNQDGERGLSSSPVVVNTLMQTPLPPVVANKRTVSGVLRITYPIKLGWNAAPQLDLSSMLAETAALGAKKEKRKTGHIEALRASDPGAVRRAAHENRKNPLRASASISSNTGKDWFKSISDWTSGDKSTEYGTIGVDRSTLKDVFSKYDKDGNGTLEAGELRHFLKDMGMPCNKNAVESCLSAMDVDKDGTVSFPEFHEWWMQHIITYVILVDNGVSDRALAQMGGQLPRGKPSYREFARISDDNPDKPLTRPSLEIARNQLRPNTMYRFAVRVVSRRGYSPISKPLELMTPPGVPAQPVLIEARSREATLKWWPGPGGPAFKYILFMRKASGRDAGGAPWKKCYEGSSNLARITNGLDPNSAYEFRVSAVNRQFVQGEPSIVLPVHTVRKIDEQKKTITSANHIDFFTIDANGDIVTGDTILFSERVFKSISGASDASNTRQKRPPKKAWGNEGSVTLSQSLDTPKLSSKFVTERTVAAVVFKESTVMSNRGGKGGPKRVLSLQVLWSEVSRNSPQAKAYNLKPGAITTRVESELFEFEVLRTRWEQEDARWSRMEELSIAEMDED